MAKVEQWRHQMSCLDSAGTMMGRPDLLRGRSRPHSSLYQHAGNDFRRRLDWVEEGEEGGEEEGLHRYVKSLRA